jgi:hypothetical protein
MVMKTKKHYTVNSILTDRFYWEEILIEKNKNKITATDYNNTPTALCLFNCNKVFLLKQILAIKICSNII